MLSQLIHFKWLIVGTPPFKNVSFYSAVSNTPPVITCPAPVAVTSLANNVGNTASWDPPTCVDAEDGTIITSVCAPPSGSFFQGVGVNTVTCTCTDSSGLSDECTFPVTVEGNQVNIVEFWLKLDSIT